MPDILPEFKVDLTRVKPGESALPEGDDIYGRRTKLGGMPDWEQDDETPNCPDCGKRMIFVAQIDSIEHDDPQNPHAVDALSPDQAWMFVDVGMIYVFYCSYCFESVSVVQFG